MNALLEVNDVAKRFGDLVVLDQPQTRQGAGAADFEGLGDYGHFDNFQKAISEHEIVVYDGHSMLGASDFLWEDFLRRQHDNLLPLLTEYQDAPLIKPQATLRKELGRLVARAKTDEARKEALNRFKDREMFWIDIKHIVEPSSGDLACGWVGEGRLAEPPGIVEAVLKVLEVEAEPGTDHRPAQHGKLATVANGPEATRIMPGKVGNRHLPTQQKRHGSGEEPEHDELDGVECHWGRDDGLHSGGRAG